MLIHTSKSITFFSRIVVALLVLVFFVRVPQAQAATTYYVSPTGSDSSNGSQATPFKTLQKAVDSIAAGDKVIVKDGTYVGADVSKGGSSSSWVTIQSENKGGAKIVSPQAHQSWGFYFYSSANYITFLDFDISGGQAGFLVDTNGHDLAFKGNKIHDVGRFCTDNTIGLVGVYLASAKNITIEGNTFQNMGRFSPGEGVNSTNTGPCQPTNTFYQNHDHGVYINGSDNILIKNNVFIDFNHGWPIQVYSGSGYTSTNLKVYNNTFAFDNPDKLGHIILSGKINGMEIKNNIFYQPRSSAIDFFEPNVTNVTVSNNLVYGVPMNTINASGMTYTNNKENVNPLMVNPTGFDFHLQATSPAVNAGVTLSDVPVDFSGTARPQGSAYDLGAFELGGVVSSPTPSPTPSPSPSPTPTPAVCKGDVNNDRVVNLSDYSLFLANFMKTPVTVASADINKDNTVNLSDYSLFLNSFLKACP